MIRFITASETRPLRQRILRPHQSAAELVYPGDDARSSFHLGAYREDSLVAIASIYQQQHEAFPRAGAWRLRGMASADEVRGEGYGGAVLREGLKQLRLRSASFLWCNARSTASSFYERFGFRCLSEPYQDSELGPHVSMGLEL